MSDTTRDIVIQQLFENVRYYQSRFSQSIVIFLGITGYSFAKALDPDISTYLKTPIKTINLVLVFLCFVGCWGFYFFIRKNYQAYQRFVGEDADLLYAFQEPKWTFYAACLLSLSAIPISIAWILI